MRVEVDGQHYDLPDDATPEEIDQATRPAPADAHSAWQKVAHYGAKALPAVGGVAGAILAGTPAIPTGAGALLTGAAGAGLGAAAGRAGQKSIDQYLGYEKPDLPRDLMDVGTTGLRDATYATGAGVAMAGLGKAAPLLATGAQNAARAIEQRILTNKVNPFGKGKLISPEALDEVAGRGAFRFGGTSSGAAERIEGMRSELGSDYGEIVSQLEKNGITGPDAQALAQKLAAAKNASPVVNSMTPAVPGAYDQASQLVATKPTQGGRLGLSQIEEMKRSAQGLARSAYKQLQPNEVGKAHEGVASILRQSTEDEIAAQSANASPAVQDLAAQFQPVKEHLGNVIEASDVAREGMRAAGKRQAFSLTDKMAALAELASSHDPIRAGAMGLGSKLLRTRGPSSASVLLRGVGSVAEAFPAVAPSASRTAIALSPAVAASLRDELPSASSLEAALAELRKKRSEIVGSNP